MESCRGGGVAKKICNAIKMMWGGEKRGVSGLGKRSTIPFAQNGQKEEKRIEVEKLQGWGRKKRQASGPRTGHCKSPPPPDLKGHRTKGNAAQNRR